MMKKIVIACFVAATAFSSCSKQLENIGIKQADTPNEFVKYSIAKGQQSSANNGFAQVQVSELKFAVKFDSSAIYTTVLPENQYDINKLYGFSDNNAPHHQFSARFGWRWSQGALRLFAYVYNNGEMSFKEITIVPLNKEINCSIKVAGEKYIFSVGEIVVTMPRTSTTATGNGYRLYPYFGGDEVAPHTINIYLKEIK